MDSAPKQFDGINQLKSSFGNCYFFNIFGCFRCSPSISLQIICEYFLIFDNLTIYLCRLRYQIEKLPGDMLLIACFISYVGGFTPIYRHELQENIWKPAFRELKARHLF